MGAGGHLRIANDTTKTFKLTQGNNGWQIDVEFNKSPEIKPGTDASIYVEMLEGAGMELGTSQANNEYSIEGLQNATLHIQMFYYTIYITVNGVPGVSNARVNLGFIHEGTVSYTLIENNGTFSYTFEDASHSEGVGRKIAETFVEGEVGLAEAVPELLGDAVKGVGSS